MDVDSSLVVQHKIENTKIFRKFAPVYDLIEIVVGSVRKDIAQDIRPESLVLDVACGTGTQAIQLAKNGHRVVGIDLSADMLKKARKKQRGLSRVEFIEKDAMHTGYADSSFDIVMISFGLHDMPEGIALAVLSEMKRVAKQSGKLYILDYGRPSNAFVRKASRMVCASWESGNYKDFTDKTISYYLAKSGLKASRRQQSLCGIVELAVIDVK